MRDILQGYAAAATPEFIALYEALLPERVYEHVLDLFPDRPTRVADLGAGTGRDAAWLAGKGHEVVAVEPVRELREAGRVLHSSERIVWLDERLPRLTEAHGHGPFGLIVLCGVWQHLTEPARAEAMPSLAAMLEPSGRLILSLRHGPGAEGRRAFPASPESTIADALRHGLDLVRRREADSVQAGNRAMGVRWTWLAFEKAAAGTIA